MSNGDWSAAADIHQVKVVVGDSLDAEIRLRPHVPRRPLPHVLIIIVDLIEMEVAEISVAEMTGMVRLVAVILLPVVMINKVKF